MKLLMSELHKSQSFIAFILSLASLLIFDCQETVQFERLGYFWKDIDSSQINPIFNRTIELRDTWSKLKAVNIS